MGTPLTLSEMLVRNLNMEPGCDAEAQANEDTLNTIKSTFKEWLRTVGLSTFTLTVEATRKLLITLVDEP